MPIVLAFDTATEVATCALVSDGHVLGERTTTAAALLHDVEAIVAGAGVAPGAIDCIAVGRGPGRYTSLRMGLVTARALSFALGVPVTGVSTLDALVAGAPGALPLVDARRREVFVLADGPACVAPEQLELEPGRLCVGDGAVRYRDVLEAAGRRHPARRRPTPYPLGAPPCAPRDDPRRLERRRADLPARPRRRQGSRQPDVIELRRLTLADLGDIERIERRSYPTPWSRSMFAGELSKPSSYCTGAVDSERDRLAGYLIVSRYVDAWHVMNVAVDIPYRGRGIARRLLDDLFAATAGDALRGYTLEVRVSNEAAIKLYERLGFKTTGVRRGYYTDNREDAYVMWKDPIRQTAVSGA